MSMFGQQKPLASLSSTLLARKGQAKPAMRPQGFGGFGTLPGAEGQGHHDDLGWNDMGVDAAFDHGQSAPAVPPVLVQREVLREEFAPVVAISETAAEAPEPTPPPARLAVVKPVSVATAARIGKETGARRGKAAFTLRLDQDRHLRLRLASALSGTSAQVLMTEALDHLLHSLPEVDALVAQLPPRKPR